jgi:hypothetical protein
MASTSLDMDASRLIPDLVVGISELKIEEARAFTFEDTGARRTRKEWTYEIPRNRLGTIDCI